MVFLLPLVSLLLSLGSTPTLDMVPPRQMHGFPLTGFTLEVLAVPNVSVDAILFTNSNSPLWSKDGTQLHALDGGRNDSYIDSTDFEDPASRATHKITSVSFNTSSTMSKWVSCSTSWSLPLKMTTQFSYSCFESPLTSSDYAPPFEDWLSKWPDAVDSLYALISWAIQALLDALTTIQMVPAFLFFTPLAFTLMHAMMLAPCAGALFLIYDSGLALLGLAIHVARLRPMGHKRASTEPISVFKSACSTSLRVCSSKLMIKFVIIIDLISYLPLSGAVGLETPKLNMHDYFLPGVSRWDGMPFHDFRRVWWLALCAALGNISQDGWSLLQTARNQDLGSPGNPGTAGQATQSLNRNQRLFGAILNYIEATSFLYNMLSRAPFANDGRGTFNFLYVYGYLPYPQHELTRMENEWVAASMSRCGIAYKPSAVFKWADYVNTLGDKLNKTNNEKRDKYLEGFPASFDVMIVNERKLGNPGSYVFPAFHPLYHPQAGVAHPNANEPDLDAMARAFYIEWARMINAGQIKKIPHGMHGYRAEEASDDELYDPIYTREEMRAVRENERKACDEIAHANMARNAVNERTVCGICGGIGHAGKVDGGGVCLTYKLGHKIPHEALSRIQYPDGYNPPRFLHARDTEPNSPRSTRDQRKFRSTPPGSSNHHRYNARSIECDEDTLEPTTSHDLATASLQVAAEAMRLSRASNPSNSRAPNSSNTAQPRTARKRFPARRPKARLTEEYESSHTPEENEREEGEEEHEGLSVSFANVEF